MLRRRKWWVQRVCAGSGGRPDYSSWRRLLLGCSGAVTELVPGGRAPSPGLASACPPTPGSAPLMLLGC